MSEGEKPKPRFFRLTTLNQITEIPAGAMVGTRRGVDYVALSYEMTEDCICEHCEAHFNTPGSSSGKTAAFDSENGGSIPSPGTT